MAEVIITMADHLLDDRLFIRATDGRVARLVEEDALMEMHTIDADCRYSSSSDNSKCSGTCHIVDGGLYRITWPRDAAIEVEGR